MTMFFTIFFKANLPLILDSYLPILKILMNTL